MKTISKCLFLFTMSILYGCGGAPSHYYITDTQAKQYKLTGFYFEVKGSGIGSALDRAVGLALLSHNKIKINIDGHELGSVDSHSNESQLYQVPAGSHILRLELMVYGGLGGTGRVDCYADYMIELAEGTVGVIRTQAGQSCNSMKNPETENVKLQLLGSKGLN